MVEHQTHRRLLVWLNTCGNIPRQSVCRLAAQLPSWIRLDRRCALSSIAVELGVPEKDLTKALDYRPLIGEVVDKELERAEAIGASILTLLDDDYPEALRDLSLPPPILYCHGRIPTRPAVAIVGSRRADPLGLEVAELFGRELAACGLTVVSGMALGVDAAAHRGAMETLTGRTLAVLGCGIDVTYPRNHRRLRKQISSQGALISEFPLGTPPFARHFPIRNRLIAALALGTLVVQGARRSGSLITARLAMDLGRDVYAIPGRIFDELAIGPNTLIRDGALVALLPRDIVESLPSSVQDRLVNRVRKKADRRPPVKGPAGEVLQAMPSGELVAADQLAETSGLAIDQVLGSLLELELTGWIRRHPGPSYQRRL
ncbi:MAG: DNA-protecting protein DprA [Acidobacteria bacterium]|nr:MAG: DNA-protecting protein DprA [Acidobacteriota bacterium]